MLFFQTPLQLKQLLLKLRQGLLDGIPNDIQIDLEIAVRHPVAHPTYLSPRDIGTPGHEIGIFVGDLCGRLTNDQDVQDHGLLRFPVLKEISFSQAFDIGGSPK